MFLLPVASQVRAKQAQNTDVDQSQYLPDSGSDANSAVHAEIDQNFVDETVNQDCASFDGLVT